MTVAHVLPSVAREAGGPSLSVRRLVEALHGAAPDIRCDTFAGDAAESPDWAALRLQRFRIVGPRRLGWAPGLRAAMVRAAPDLIHLHSLWGFHAWTAFRAAEALGRPLVISPRGMLDPWALQQGRLQKSIANRLFQRRMLQRAACIVVTSELEADGVRLAGYRDPAVAIVPNGIDPVPAEWLAFRSPPPGPRVALFLSRLAPKKGLLELLRAWQEVAPADWRLRIMGPSERGYADVVAAEIRARDLGRVVELSGPVWGEDKRRAFAGAHLFVLPSYSENFGLAIGEAMAAALPVLTTQATPWREIASAHCGWWIEPGVEALIPALREALTCSPDELRARGARARELIASRYTWSAVGRDMAEVYRRVLRTGRSAP